MKTCSRCDIEKPLEDFRFRNKTKNIRAPWCKSCFSEYERNKWRESPERRRSNTDANKQRRKARAKLVWEYLKCHPCECGESDPIVLEFDHNGGVEKFKNVSDMIRSGYSENTLLTEIAKCTVRCVMCHRRRTAIQQGWYKDLI